MRLELPRVQSVSDERTGACLVRTGGTSNRDMPGTIFSITVPSISGQVRIKTTVEDITASVADKYSKENGVDNNSLKMSEQMALDWEFAKRFGKTFLVWNFETDHKLDDRKFVELRNLFIRMFFELNSSYKYNSDDNQSQEGFYTDELRFLPYFIDKRFYETVKAESVQ